MPLPVKKFSQEKISLGIISEKLVIPNAVNSAFVDAAIAKGSGLPINVTAINPPRAVPNTKRRFQISFFQS